MKYISRECKWNAANPHDITVQPKYTNMFFYSERRQSELPTQATPAKTKHSDEYDAFTHKVISIIH